jgi:hypothetical protein
MATATLAQRIKAFINSPAGRSMIDMGRRELAKPQNQQKLRALAAKVAKRR